MEWRGDLDSPRRRQGGSALRKPHEPPFQGEILFYPGGLSEAEIILAYGGVSFASKVGPLAGNHFLTIVEGMENLPVLGRLVLWEGAQEILFEPGLLTIRPKNGVPGARGHRPDDRSAPSIS